MPRPAALTPRTRVRADRGPVRDLAITEIAANLTFAAADVTAWYAVPETVWAFRPDPEREALMTAIAEQYAGLGRSRLHLRRTTRPFDVQAWRQRLGGRALPPPDTPRAPTPRRPLPPAGPHPPLSGLPR